MISTFNQQQQQQSQKRNTVNFMSKRGPRCAQQRAKPTKRGETKKAAVNASSEEKAAYWAAKRAGDLQKKNDMRKNRNAKRREARKAAKLQFSASRKSR